MRKLVPGTLIIVAVLVGCASLGSSEPARNTTSSEVAQGREIEGVRENLIGVCEAIMRYGLPLDAETRSYIRAKIESVKEFADADPESPHRITAIEALEQLVSRFEKCDPVLAAEIRETSSATN